MSPLLLPQVATSLQPQNGLASLLNTAGQNDPWVPPTSKVQPGIAPGQPAPGGMGAPAQYRGLAGFVDRFIHPTNPIGQLGKYISQASGGVFGGVYNAADQDLESQQSQQMQRTKYALELAKLNQPDYGADEKLLIAAGYTPGSPQYQAAARSLFDRKSDPTVTVSLPDGIYSGPQSGLGGAISGVGGQPSPAPAVAPPPATLPPDFDFGAGDAPISNMGIAPDAVSPGGSTPTVLSRADAAPFLKSLGREGFARWMTKHNIRLGN